MEITYDVPIPERTDGGRKWVKMLHTFMDSSHTNMCITLNDKGECNNVAIAFRTAIKRRKADIIVCRRGNCVYLLKGDVHGR